MIHKEKCNRILNSIIARTKGYLVLSLRPHYGASSSRVDGSSSLEALQEFNRLALKSEVVVFDKDGEAIGVVKLMGVEAGKVRVGFKFQRSHKVVRSETLRNDEYGKTELFHFDTLMESTKRKVEKHEKD